MFRTTIDLASSPTQINIKNHVFTVGSCFSDFIGSMLTKNKFHTLNNVFGTVYNPISIHRSVLYGLKNQMPHEQTYLQHEDVYLNFDFHSKFSGLKREDLDKKIRDAIDDSTAFLPKTDWLIITYGTSWVYERKDTGEIVANCHKIPNSHFSKVILSQKKILDDFEKFYNELLIINPGINIILTVSPVRHLKDSIELNSVSKSVLRLACHTISSQFSHVQYFPSYEIMLDDLRDYRFYKADMIHPNDEAEEYIWSNFIKTYFDEETKAFVKEWGSIFSSLNHKPFHPESIAHQNFLNNLLERLQKLNGAVDLGPEIDSVKKQIISK